MAAAQDTSQQADAGDGAKRNTKTNARRFHCPQCTATFARSSHMRRHQRTRRKDAIIRHTRAFHPQQALDYNSKENEQTEIVGDEIVVSHESHLGDCNAPEDPVRLGWPASSHCPVGETQTHLPMPVSPPQMDLGSMDLDSWLHFNAGAAAALGQSPHGSHAISGGSTSDTTQLDFDRAFDLQLFDSAIFTPLNQLVDLGSMPQGEGDAPSMPAALPEAGTPVSENEDLNAQKCLGVTADAHSRAKANFSRLTGQERPSDMHFPSRPAMTRFVKAYFTHMAPYVPLVHRPTFDISSISPLLLLEIMACGAVYSNEMKVAMTMHRNVLKYLLIREFTSICDDTRTEFELWRLQTLLLATYFGIFSGDSNFAKRARFTFYYSIELAEAGIKKLAIPTPESQTTWIYQEALSRCISCTIIIASGYFSTSVNQPLRIPYLDSKYPLPGSTPQWSRVEASEDTVNPYISNSEIMADIMHGNKPPSNLSEYAFLAVVCNIRCRICSFEAFSISCHTSLRSTFIETMDAAMNTLNQVRSQMNYEHSNPLHRHTNSALNSAHLHLYTSHELSGMKRLLRNPDVLRDPQELSSLFDRPCSPQLKRGLICAAKTLQLDLDTGVEYLRITAPLRFDPLEIHALCESGLLLFWYLMSKKTNPRTFELHQDISDMVQEVLSEVKDLKDESRVASLPLAACATIIGLSTAVWRHRGLRREVGSLEAAGQTPNGVWRSGVQRINIRGASAAGQTPLTGHGCHLLAHSPHLSRLGLECYGQAPLQLLKQKEMGPFLSVVFSSQHQGLNEGEVQRESCPRHDEAASSHDSPFSQPTGNHSSTDSVEARLSPTLCGNQVVTPPFNFVYQDVSPSPVGELDKLPKDMSDLDWDLANSVIHVEGEYCDNTQVDFFPPTMLTIAQENSSESHEFLAGTGVEDPARIDSAPLANAGQRGTGNVWNSPERHDGRLGGVQSIADGSRAECHTGFNISLEAVTGTLAFQPRNPLEQHLFQYFQERLCPLLSSSYNTASNDYMRHLIPAAHFEPAIYTAVAALSAAHLSLLAPHYHPLAARLRACAQSATGIVIFGLADNGGCYGDLLSSIMMNAIEITDGKRSKIGQRLRWCKQKIANSWGDIGFFSDIVRWIVRNVAFHDVLCTSSMLSGEVTVNSKWWTAYDGVDTIMGICQPIFLLLGKIGQLAYMSRTVTRRGSDLVGEVSNIYLEAKYLEQTLDLLCCPPGYDLEHRLMFQLHCSAARLFLWNCVYNMNAASLVVQNEVYQIRRRRCALLGELDANPHSNRGVLHTSHWIIFNAAVNSIDCLDIISKDYSVHMKEFQFRNLEGSFELVKKVRQLNKGGSVAINWLDIVQKEGIELIFV
ncbi:hypothetical protein LCI18_013779 [Fusarium solani-melongenae]|uniref:Uncharacterized protein n=1 Tax=Fusarium solani subsp. cucurbitae TaxID=2747967 RepID=A0ACD3ZNH9_FUSSC|nr:hypothetical protein LCI18_013779 [Fusarium solani-melongenae]